MLTADVRFEGFSTEDWTRVFGLLQDPSASSHSPSYRGLIVVHDQGEVLKVLHTGQGRIDPSRMANLGLAPMRSASTPHSQPSPGNLASIARAFGVDWVVSMQVGAFDDVMERFGATLRREDDLLGQVLKFAGCMCEVMDEGGIAFWPSRVRGAFMRSPRVLQAGFDILCADGSTLALGVFDRETLYTVLVARRRGRAFDLVVGPEFLGDAAHPRDWRRGLPALTDAITQRVGPLALGVFGELSPVREIMGGAPSGSLVRAVLAKHIILSPPTIVTGVALGIDAVGGLLRALRSTCDRATGRVTLGEARWGPRGAPLVDGGARWGPRGAPLVEPRLDTVVPAVSRRLGCDGRVPLGLDAISALRLLLAR